METQASAMNRGRAITQETLDEIVRRIVQVAQPDRIILFGSAARGTMGPHSDIDLLVIKRGTFHRRQLAAEIHSYLSDVDYAFDVIVATPQDVERYGHSHALILKPALREGKVVYDAATV